MDYNRSGPKKTPCLTDNCGLLWSLWWTYHGRKIAHKQNKNQLSTTSNATLTTDVIHSNRWETKATATRKWAWDGNCWIFEWRMTGRVHYPRPSVEFFIDSSTASRSISPTSAAYVKLAENFAERWAELRLVESVNQRIENNDGHCFQSRSLGKKAGMDVVKGDCHCTWPSSSSGPNWPMRVTTTSDSGALEMVRPSC